MTFFPLAAFNDNYIWITLDTAKKSIWAVDPGDAKVVLDYCHSQKVTLEGILVTHHHKDHTGGIQELVQHFECPVYGPESLAPHLVSKPIRQGEEILVHGTAFLVLETPGHTLDHLCYFAEPSTSKQLLLCGDTLFRGGCGRLFEGSPAQMLSSMMKLRSLPPETLVYGTHEYTLSNYRFALAIDPNNSALIEADKTATALRDNETPTLPSTIALEQQTNPFMRFDREEVVAGAAALLNEPMAMDTINSFAQIRRAKDGF
ncbi:hydroxyacylglutathione hydrolase [Marinomonas ostreistagni]|uniref:Hydroxyacylglutathione hydrolase n=1 Tax=Marinomonas ostreistagni TaxID=359209 RepID=A0ABS0Z8T3_9GAMM|nr:hydroxyacylglutathione hydrolase [Marinomonas ostreistagni]MBJ7549623.1 hydroxyacylglutathione hydrolase [Marinomonas ostreistagni]